MCHIQFVTNYLDTKENLKMDFFRQYTSNRFVYVLINMIRNKI